MWDESPDYPSGFEPSERTLNVLLKSFCSGGQLREAMEVFNTYIAGGQVCTADL